MGTLTAEQHATIRARYAGGSESQQSLADAFGVSQAQVSRIVRGTRPAERHRDLPAQAVRDQMLALHYAAGLYSREVGAICGVGSETVLRAAKRFDCEVRRPGHRRWKPGRYTNRAGYVVVRMRPSDPMAEMGNAWGWVRESRLLVARAVGRPLRRDEQVHHKDGDRANNRLGNLQLRIGNHGTGRAARCAACGSHDVEFVEV